MEQNMLITYVKDEDMQPIGVVVATAKNEVGWSKLNKADKWDKKKGKMIAINRAMNGFKTEVPELIKSNFDSMIERSVAYFK